MSSMDKLAVVAYVASPHAGYLRFFRKYAGSTLYILGPEFLKEHEQVTRHLPGNAPEDSCRMVESLGIFAKVSVLAPENLAELGSFQGIIMPDEDVSHAFAERHLPNADIAFDGEWRLRWDWCAVHANLTPPGVPISLDVLDRELMGKAAEAAERSPDWWRQVGALLARDGTPVLVAFNAHMPAEQSAYLMGDPRSNFGPGERIEVSGALHAEVGLIAEAAKRGISMEGCDLYVTTFPCPPCAYACAKTGIRRLLYAGGYSLLAGAEALESRGVEIVHVDMDSPSS